MLPLGELVRRGAIAELRSLESRSRAREAALASFVDRLKAAPTPDLDGVDAIRRAQREP